MSSQNVASPEEQSATFIELFFDLVFVFSVTQIVGLFHHGVTWPVVGQSVLVFWLVWWAWTQFTWALNAADTTHPLVELGTLLATAIAFFMAVAVPDAFHGAAWSFAVPYVLVRVVGLSLYAWVASENPAQRTAVTIFAAVSAGGLAAVLIGSLMGGAAQYVLWGLAILLDVFAAAVGGQMKGWNLHPEHFGERHGLFVIIALGETLIVAAGGLTGADWTPNLFAVAFLAVAVTCGFWWTYFTRAKPTIDDALASSDDVHQTTMARDVGSLAHFPMLCGVIAYAVALEEAVAHPDEPLGLAGRIALSAAVVLFVGGMAVALRRATGRLPAARASLCVLTGVVVVGVSGVAPALSLAIAFSGVLAVAVSER